MVDALASGASGRKAVEVRVLSWAPQLLIFSFLAIRFLPWIVLGTQIARLDVSVVTSRGSKAAHSRHGTILQ